MISQAPKGPPATYRCKHRLPSDNSSTDDEESFVQTGRNIDDNNAEAAEMAHLEDQSDKDMGEDDKASAATDESSTDDEESLV